MTTPGDPESLTAEGIRLWRIRHDVTQETLAAMLGVKVLAVKRWELSQRRPPGYLRLALERLSQILRERYFLGTAPPEPERRHAQHRVPPRRSETASVIRVVTIDDDDDPTSIATGE